MSRRKTPRPRPPRGGGKRSPRSLTGLAAETALDLDAHIRQHLRALGKEPGEPAPGKPLPPGSTGPPLPVKSSVLTGLVRAALVPSPDRGSVVWQDRDSEVIAHLGETRVEVLEGLVLVGIPLECQETGRVELTVPFAVGAAGKLAGMIALTERAPRGPPLLVSAWGEAVIAAAWRALVEVTTRLAGQAGNDAEGDRLIPGAMVASKGVLEIIPQAMHAFHRKPSR